MPIEYEQKPNNFLIEDCSSENSDNDLLLILQFETDGNIAFVFEYDDDNSSFSEGYGSAGRIAWYYQGWVHLEAAHREAFYDAFIEGKKPEDEAEKRELVAESLRARIKREGTGVRKLIQESGLPFLDSPKVSKPSSR